jgi:phosphoglycolate phosphatase-like HAD superfamily hydrolase
MRTLCLFDVDGTLIRGFDEHAQAFAVGLSKTYGVDPSEVDLNNICFHGMTDWQIIEDILKSLNFPQEIINSKISECFDEMANYFESVSENAKISLLPGVPELLAKLSVNLVNSGLVTGNIKKIAYAKMRHLNLDKYFPIGGFGNDSKVRSNLIRLACRRAMDHHVCEFDKIFVIGDTEKDIWAGKDAGIKTIGVATGIYSSKQLKAVRATYVLEDLRDADEFLNIISK